MTTTSNHYVTVLWEARAKSGKEAAMKAFMTAAVTASRYDAGNIDYEAHQVEGQPGAFVIFERWESRQALESHLQAPRMQYPGDCNSVPAAASTEPTDPTWPVRHAASPWRPGSTISFRRSAAVSPTVVHSTPITQKQTVTSDTLFQRSR